MSIDENPGFLFFFFREENVTEKDVCDCFSFDCGKKTNEGFRTSMPQIK
jgi:hypothetical protein